MKEETCTRTFASWLQVRWMDGNMGLGLGMGIGIAGVCRADDGFYSNLQCCERSEREAAQAIAVRSDR